MKFNTKFIFLYDPQTKLADLVETDWILLKDPKETLWRSRRDYAKTHSITDQRVPGDLMESTRIPTIDSP